MLNSYYPIQHTATVDGEIRERTMEASACLGLAGRQTPDQHDQRLASHGWIHRSRSGAGESGAAAALSPPHRPSDLLHYSVSGLAATPARG